MRQKLIALLALLTILPTLVTPLIGQSKGMTKVRQPEIFTKSEPSVPKRIDKQTTRFASTEAYSTGQGTWLRWRMDLETDNAGFYVYKYSKSGLERVSNLISGSAFQPGNLPLTSSEYAFFDASGEVGTSYYISAHGMDGKNVNSAIFSASYVTGMGDVKGGEAIQRMSAIGPGAYIASEEANLNSELKAEVAFGKLVADPDKHRQVISQPGVRIGAKDAGVIRVSIADLQANGFDTASDPSLWQLYREGVEVPIILGPKAQYLEFLNKKLDTVESDARVYYLIVGSEPGKRMRNVVSRPAINNVVATKYSQTFQYTEKINYLSNILNGDQENFWGNGILSGGTNFDFTLTGIDRTPGTRRMVVDVQGYSSTSHTVKVFLNNVDLDVSMFGSFHQPMSVEIDVPVELLNEGANTLRLLTTASNDICVFNKLSIDFDRTYLAVNNKLNFYTDNYKTAKLSGFSTPNIRVFDLTYENEPRVFTNLRVDQTGATWGAVIPAAKGRVLYAAEASQFSSPVFMNAYDTSLIGTAATSGTLTIISHKSLLPGAQAWAAYRDGQGISTKVIDVDEVYDEFNYGVASSLAIKNFLNYARKNWQTPPQYVLFFGDASVDPRNYEGRYTAGYGSWNMVPSRQVDTLFGTTGSDDALLDFDNDGLAEIAVGRISVRTLAEATVMLNKTIAWENSLTPTSIERGALMAHDSTGGDGIRFDLISQRLIQHLPSSMPITAIERGSPNAVANVINAFNEIDPVVPANSGQYLVNYTGHGTATAWNSGFFSSTNVPSLTNQTNPSIVMALTCLNGYFMGNGLESFAENITKAPNGGAVVAWASTGLTTPDVQEVMATRFFQKLAEGNIQRMGDLTLDAKSVVVGGTDVRLSWALIGDPMLKVR